MNEQAITKALETALRALTRAQRELSDVARSTRSLNALASRQAQSAADDLHGPIEQLRDAYTDVKLDGVMANAISKALQK